MIVSIEGPDKSGKTTVFEEVKRRLAGQAVFVPSIHTPKELFPVMPFVERRQSDLWELLYDPMKLYVCDRHVATSGAVYSVVMGRPLMVDLAVWKPRLYMAYIRVPLDELLRRHEAEPDEYLKHDQLSKCVSAYEALARFVKGFRFDGTKTKDQLATEVCEYIRSLRR